jgi:hypothetical protein
MAVNSHSGDHHTAAMILPATVSRCVFLDL